MSDLKGQNGRTATADRTAIPLAPHSVEAEEGVLGAILINPDAIYDMPFLSPGDFFIVRHGWIFEAILWLHQQRRAIDNMTVAARLRDAGRLDEAGGAPYLSYLITQTPTTMHAATYARQVEEAAVRRRLLDAASAIARLSHDTDLTLADVLAEVETVVADVTRARTGAGPESYGAIAARVYERLEWLVAHPDAERGVPTGFAEFDRRFGGFAGGDLVLVAARPSMGKSAWLQQCAEQMARGGRRVAFFSLEMSREQIVQRSLARAMRLNSHAIRDGRLSEFDWRRAVGALAGLEALPLVVDDAPGQTPATIRAACQRLRAQVSLDAVFVDYLGLMQSGLKGLSLENRTSEVTAISAGLQRLARELGCPVIVASQLNRAVEQRGNKRPTLADLRDSGALEQDADIVAFLYRENYYDENARGEAGVAEFIVAKNRNGALGTVEFWFTPETVSFNPVEHRNLNEL